MYIDLSAASLTVSFTLLFEPDVTTYPTWAGNYAISAAQMEPISKNLHTFALHNGFVCKQGRPGVIPGSHIYQ